MLLPQQLEPNVSFGPSHPREAFLLASIFLLREVELSATRLEHVAFDVDAATVTWSLTASRTDPAANGVTRTWGYLRGLQALPCPFRLARTVVDSAFDFA